MVEQILNDTLNLKDLILSFTSFIRENSQSSPLNTMLGFIEELFKNLDLSEKDLPDIQMERLITDIQKLLSGNMQSQKVVSLARVICSGALDALLQKNIASIVMEVNTATAAPQFWSDLVVRASELYFSREEILFLQDRISLQTDEGYVACLLQLLKHGFATLDNIPAFAAKRFYEEAQTYDYDQPARFRLLKVAADYGNKQAALEYGNYMNRTRPDGQVPPLDAAEAFKYTLLALPLPSAMWNLAYQLESLQLTGDQTELLFYSVKIDDKLRGSEFDRCRHELGLVTCTATPNIKRQSFLYAYKMYFYLGYSGFSKGFNSIAKFLKVDSFGFSMPENTYFQNKSDLCNYYYRKAVSGGCISAMQNLGIQRYKEQKNNEDPLDISYTKQLLQTAAYYGLQRSMETLGMFYLHCLPAPDYHEAKKCFLELNSYGENGNACYWLGMMAASWSEKADLFRRAMNAGNVNAAYQYALAEQEMYEMDRETSHIRRAINALEQYAPRMTPEAQRQARNYQRELIEIFEKV